MHRLAGLRAHLCSGEEARATGTLATDSRFGDLPLYSWQEVMSHNTLEDIWVVIEGKVSRRFRFPPLHKCMFTPGLQWQSRGKWRILQGCKPERPGQIFDMTAFIPEHPGGADIPLGYAGKDATEFWLQIHDHVRDFILEDLLEGESTNLGIEQLPTLVGLIDPSEPVPAEAGSTYGLDRYWSRNWAGNIVWSHDGNIAEPATVAELQEVVRGADKLRCIGRGHAFPDVCDSSELMVSLRHMHDIISVDEEALTVTVQGGINYSQLVAYLARSTEMALQNVACLSTISLAGGTGTISVT